jgi:hypothetical protein
MRASLLLRFFLLVSLGINRMAVAQCGLYQIALEEKVRESSLIIEGYVVNQHCFKHQANRKIYTLNTIQVYAFFKGKSNRVIQIITAGGRIENEMEVASSLLTLQKGMIGMFFLNQSLDPLIQDSNVYDVYSSAQGFYNYNLNENKVSDVFHEISNQDGAFYQMLSNDYGLYKTIEYNAVNWNNQNESNRLTIINDFSPLSINAGAGEQLTINGFGFGNFRDTSKVWFKNADNGGSTEIAAEASQYISWSDTKIVLVVPGKAGSGRIAVSVGAIRDQSSQSLKVNYAFINTGANALLYIPKHIARNANKGYVWNMNVNFERDSTAVADFLVSFKKWRCKTYVNWTIGKHTDIDFSEKDTLSVITFDERNELPAGVLGLCYAYYSGCTEDDWYIEEQDLLFRKTDRWYFGEGVTPSNKVDFQSVALHELGHAHQLAHVIDNTDLMHYSISQGVQKRNIEALNLEAAQLMIKMSNESVPCGKAKMQLLDADLCNDELFGFYNYIIYPNPFSDVLNVELYLTRDDQLKIQLFDLAGRLLGVYENSKAEKGLIAIKFSMPESTVSTGVYMLKIDFGNEKNIRKLMKFSAD